MAERGLEPSPAAVAALPPEVRAQLAELELELSEGDITQKGYEKKRSKLLSPYSPQTQETDSIGQKERNQTPAPTAAQTSAPSKYHRSRSGGARDERYRSVKGMHKGSNRSSLMDTADEADSMALVLEQKLSSHLEIQP